VVEFSSVWPFCPGRRGVVSSMLSLNVLMH
jgi:hypothetical protein